MVVADNDILILTFLASSILLLTASLGLSGTLLTSRPILALYALLLWPAAHSLVTSFSSVGESDRVASYRRRRPCCGSSEARSAVGPPNARTHARASERAGKRMNGRAE